MVANIIFYQDKFCPKDPFLIRYHYIPPTSNSCFDQGVQATSLDLINKSHSLPFLPTMKLTVELSSTSKNVWHMKF